MTSTRIAGAALNQTVLDWNNNLSNILEAIQTARENKVAILCLPELCITGYGCEDIFLSEWLPAKALDKLDLIIPHTDGIAVCVGLPLRFEGILYNCAAMLSDGKLLGFTAKQFMANDGVHYEPRWFTPWPSGLQKEIQWKGNTYPIGDVTYTIKGIKIGFEICEDAWRPERPGICHARNGVKLILNPSASHFAFGKSQIRYNLVLNGSRDFNCAYVYADLLGNETGRMIFDGEVLIARNGQLIQRNDRLSFKNVNLVWADVDFNSNAINYPPLTHDDQEKEAEFWEATCLGLFDYLRKSRSKGFVLSLSGGADSSACAVMVSEMVKKGIQELGATEFLRKGNISDLFTDLDLNKIPAAEQHKRITSRILYTAYQSTKNSGTETLTSAQELADSIGATFYHWNVDEEVNAYSATIEKVLGRKLSWESDDIAMQNIQARSRAPIIWMLANIKRALLITTSNRSEGDVGYATMDGDTAGSIAPIAGVDKHFIRYWLQWAEKNKNQMGLHRVNQLTPTAELRPAERVQTDEKDLMPYDILADIERQAIRNRKSPTEVFHILKTEKKTSEAQLKIYITKFFRMWSINQWKRERIAPSFHLDDFNVDPRTWCRFPILSGSFEEELKELNNA